MEKQKPVKLTPGQRAEASSAREVLLSCAKAIKAQVMYLPNNPLRGKFTDDFFARIRTHLDDHGDLGLYTEHSRFLMHGAAVYDEPDLNDNIAFKLFADGIRFLEIRKEIEDEELGAFMAILGRDRSPDDDDDIVTEFWEEDFGGISFNLAEESADTGRESLGVRPDDTAMLHSGIEKVYAAEPPPGQQQAPALLDIPQNVFVLSDVELEELSETIRFELERQPLEDLSDILLSILLAEEEAGTFTEFIESLGTLCRDMIVLGRLESALHIAAILPVLQEADKVPSAHREVVRGVKGRILTENAIAALTRAIDMDEGISRAQFTKIISIFGTDAIAPLCLLLGKIEKRNMRKALVEALVENGKNAPRDFFPFIGDSRWYLVRNTVHILRRIGSPEATREITPLIVHGDHRVRREVLQYFEELEGDEAGAHLLRFLKDRDDGIRASALKILARRKDSRAMRFLSAAVGDRSFMKKEIGERESLLDAMGRIDPEAAVEVCRGMLGRRHLLNKTAEWEAALCAAAGLRAAGTPEALEVLRDYGSSKRGKAGDLLRETLAELVNAENPP